MNRLINKFVLLTIFCFGGFILHAESIISADELYDKFGGENIQIIACQKEADFKISHIKGAINLWHSEMYKKPVGMGILMPPQELADYLGNKGIDFSKQIILYDDGSNKYSSRVFWALKYLGVADVSVLNGHFDTWFSKGYPVTKNPTPVKKVQNSISLQEDIYAGLMDVKAISNNPNTVLIDVRSKDEFRNIGHIPGATLFYWESVLQQNKNFKDREIISEIAKIDGLGPEKEIILYCATAVKASVVYFALKEIAHFPHVKIYDGAFKEWTSFPSAVIIK